MRGFSRNLRQPWEPIDEPLTLEEAAEFLGWPPELLKQAHERGVGPVPNRHDSALMGELMYDLSVLEDFYDMGFSPDLAVYGYYNVPEEFRTFDKGEDGKWHDKKPYGAPDDE
jgi:hypothetical protein